MTNITDRLFKNYIYNLRIRNTAFFYFIKPIIPRCFQLFLRRRFIKYIRLQFADTWPINDAAKKKPEGFKGWPEDKKFAVVLTHDVDTEKGQEYCVELAGLEESLGFRSSFNFVPERYNVNPELRKYLADRGFEIGVHGLNHDGKLYKDYAIFSERAKKINRYLKEWNAVGFRSPSMHHNLTWIHDLDIEYDSSCFDTDPFEPQPDGVGTIFPFIEAEKKYEKNYVELPYTLAQDFTLFILMKEKNIDIWKQKIDWVASNGGMVLLSTHPDFMHFGNGKIGKEEYPAEYYFELLQYLKDAYGESYWHCLPKDMAGFWSKMK